MVPSAVTPSARFWLTAEPSAESSVRGKWCMDKRSLEGGQTEISDAAVTTRHLKSLLVFGQNMVHSGCDAVTFVFLLWFAAVFLKKLSGFQTEIW